MLLLPSRSCHSFDEEKNESTESIYTPHEESNWAAAIANIVTDSNTQELQTERQQQQQVKRVIHKSCAL